MKKIGVIITLFITAFTLTACGGSANSDGSWSTEDRNWGKESAKELYKNALEENGLTVYTVSSRAADVKESFEKEYPGIKVEIRDLRSPTLIDAIKENVDRGKYEADVVICNDNSGEFKRELVDTGRVVPYIPKDIEKRLKDGYASDTVTLVDEGFMLFYNGNKYDECPIKNIWELTEGQFMGKIIAPSPLKSFSSYALYSQLYLAEDELAASYESYKGEKYEGNEPISQYFLRALSKNTYFSDSSDDVVEAVGGGGTDYDLGFTVSSKLRYNEKGYQLMPATQVEPFCGVKVSYAVMIAQGSKNINTAKLFIRYLFGEKDGSGEGYKPFITVGTWPARTDVADVNPPELKDISLMTVDQDALVKKDVEIRAFFSLLIKD